MHDAERVRLGDGLARLQHVVAGDLDRQRSLAREHARQVRALEVLHDEVGQAGLQPAHVEHVGDVIAPELGHRARLAKEPLGNRCVLRERGMYELDGDELVELCVTGCDDDPHPTLADDVLDAVLAPDDVTRGAGQRFHGRNLP